MQGLFLWSGATPGLQNDTFDGALVEWRRFVQDVRAHDLSKASWHIGSSADNGYRR